jgi:hypothetical protein
MAVLISYDAILHLLVLGGLCSVMIFRLSVMQAELL